MTISLFWARVNSFAMFVGQISGCLGNLSFENFFFLIYFVKVINELLIQSLLQFLNTLTNFVFWIYLLVHYNDSLLQPFHFIYLSFYFHLVGIISWILASVIIYGGLDLQKSGT